jgi:hypothetical protein
MSIEQILTTLERQGWEALTAGRGAGFYREHLTADALMVFPFGVLEREQSIEAIDAAPPWATYHIDESRVIALDGNSALITYRVTAQREGQPPYTAILTSGYVRRDGAWKLAFHQQTPLDQN